LGLLAITFPSGFFVPKAVDSRWKPQQGRPLARIANAEDATLGAKRCGNSNCRQPLAVSGTTGIFSAASAAPRLMAADYSLQHGERLPETIPSFRCRPPAKFQLACNLVGMSFIPVGTPSKHGRHLCTKPAKTDIV